MMKICINCLLLLICVIAYETICNDDIGYVIVIYLYTLCVVRTIYYIIPNYYPVSIVLVT